MTEGTATTPYGFREGDAPVPTPPSLAPSLGRRSFLDDVTAKVRGCRDRKKRSRDVRRVLRTTLGRIAVRLGASGARQGGAIAQKSASWTECGPPAAASYIFTFGSPVKPSQFDFFHCKSLYFPRKIPQGLRYVSNNRLFWAWARLTRGIHTASQTRSRRLSWEGMDGCV